MDRQIKMYILLAVGVAALVFVIFFVTLPGMRNVAGQEKAHAQEHAKMKEQVENEIVKPSMTGPVTTGEGITVTPGTAEGLSLRTVPPPNPFKYVESKASAATAQPGQSTTITRVDTPVGPLPISGGNDGGGYVQPRPVEEPNPEVPVLKGVALGNERLAVLHYGGNTLYVAQGQRIDKFWKVLRISKDRVTLVDRSNKEVPIEMKGD